MVGLRILARLNPDFVSLEANAAQAGCALACSYSSSDEFEAAIIAKRREAGDYSWPRRRQLIAGAGVLLALIAAGFLFI